MIDALGLEVAAIRKRSGGIHVELRGGERCGEAEGSYLYRFVVAEDLNLRDDTPVRVTSGQEDVQGVLVSFRDGVLVVALEKDLGSKIATARLVADDSFLIERLKERLEKVRSGEVQLNQKVAERVLNPADSRVAEAEPHAAAIQGDASLHPDQLRAVRRSLGSDITFVWGPPGTGKTTTLACVIDAHYRAGRSVLLVSNTNIAVDIALERVAERLKGDSDFHQGLVIRQGPVVKDELRQRFGPQVILEEIVTRLGESLKREKDKLSREAARLETEENSLTTALRHVEQLARTRRRLEEVERRREIARSNATARAREAEQHRSRTEKIRADLEHARTMGAVRRFFSGLNRERLQREIAAGDRAAQAATEAARALAADISRYEAEVVSVRVEVDRLTGESRGYPAESQINSLLGAVRTSLGRTRNRISQIDHELAELEQQILARCKILATTVYRTYLSKSAPRQFDVVVIDEASMLMPPLVYYAAGLATQSITVAGDFRQLPPIVASEQALAEKWLKRDVFHIAGIPRRLAERQPTQHLVALGIQHRMREPICAVINELFYADHPLRSDPLIDLDNFLFPLGEAPLVYINTAPFHPWTAVRVGTYSRYNLFHALLVRNIVLHLAQSGILPPEGKPNNAVGVVAPYAAQARLIQALLDDRLGTRAAGIAATVHRFQGNEKSAMVIDLTDSLGAPLSRFLKATHLEEDGARLLNVAVSRAKRHVVLLGNFDYLRMKAPGEGFVRHLIDHFKEHGKPLDIHTLLPIADRDWVDGLHRVLPATFDLPEGAAGAFTEGTFYPAFLKDLARARESIVVLSPFATGAGTARWIDPLRAALARSVRVRILTRPSDAPSGGAANDVKELVHALRDLGVTVDLRSRMHEKIAILDGHILWHGSLNILSHRDTHESMLRIESAAACSQLARFVSTPAGRSQQVLPLDALKNPECPKCGGAMVWNQGRHGIYFECEDPNCDGKLDVRRRGPGPRAGGAIGAGTDRPRRGQDGRNASDPMSRQCPQQGCGGYLVKRSGRYGPFLGCANYPKCWYTEQLH